MELTKLKIESHDLIFISTQACSRHYSKCSPNQVEAQPDYGPGSEIGTGWKIGVMWSRKRSFKMAAAELGYLLTKSSFWPSLWHDISISWLGMDAKNYKFGRFCQQCHPSVASGDADIRPRNALTARPQKPKLSLILKQIFQDGGRRTCTRTLGGKHQGWGQIRFIKYKYKYKYVFFRSFKYKYKYKYTGKNLIKYKYKYSSSNTNTNTQWGRDKIAAILQMTYWILYCKKIVYTFKFHWKLFLKVQSTISLHWFR